MGTDFTFVAPAIAVGAKFGLPGIFGATILGAIIEVILSFFVKPLMKLFPPIVTGTVVCLIGLTLSHKKEHILRAGLEGVVYSLYSVGEALERLAGQPVNLFASGGFARSPLWLQIVADIFGHPVKVPESHQSSAWGAAWFALLAIGEVSSLEAIKDSIPMKQTYEPDVISHEVYKELYVTYRQLYAALKPHFSTLASFQRKN